MVCPRTVSYWDRDKRPTKLHERIMERFVEEGSRDPNLHAWIHDQLETTAPLDIVTNILARGRELDLAGTIPSEDVQVLRRALANEPRLLAALERVLASRTRG